MSGAAVWKPPCYGESAVDRKRQDQKHRKMPRGSTDRASPFSEQKRYAGDEHQAGNQPDYVLAEDELKNCEASAKNKHDQFVLPRMKIGFA